MTTHRRICFSCGHNDLYADSILPACACTNCGSADTRKADRVMSESLPFTEKQPLGVFEADGDEPIRSEWFIEQGAKWVDAFDSMGRETKLHACGPIV